MRSSMELVDRAKVNARSSEDEGGSSDELLPYKNLKVLFPRSSEEIVARARSLVEITRDKRLARASFRIRNFSSDWFLSGLGFFLVVYK